MKCKYCNNEMECWAQTGEDIDYYKFEHYICNSCHATCDVDIEGETTMETHWTAPYDTIDGSMNYGQCC